MPNRYTHDSKAETVKKLGKEPAKSGKTPKGSTVKDDHDGTANLKANQRTMQATSGPSYATGTKTPFAPSNIKRSDGRSTPRKAK